MSSLIFIGGAPRSGTTLVQRILDLHSQIYAGPEFDHLISICNTYQKMKKGLKNGRQVFYYNEEHLKRSFSTLISDFLIAKAKREGVNYLSEKTPANILVFNELKELFPTAKFVFVVRDPRATICSFNEVAKRALKFGNKVSVGHELLRDIRMIDQHLKAGNEFYLENREQCHIVKYGELVNSPTKEIQRLCDFLEIPFESAMVELNSKEGDSSKLINSSNNTVSAWVTKEMVEKGISKLSLNKWQHDLTKIQKIIVNDFFAIKDYECLKSYSFQKSDIKEKVAVLPIYVKEYGIVRVFKEFRRRIFK